VNRLGDTGDTGELDFANRKWHYDTRYFNTTFPSMKRVVVRVYPGDSKSKGNPIAESTGFLGASLGVPGMSNVDWTQGSGLQGVPCTPSGVLGNGGVNAQQLIGGAAPNSNCMPTPAPSGTPTPGVGGAIPQSPSTP
jgi:hypothetical protein